jgi:preprotein translocase subunit SecY
VLARLTFPGALYLAAVAALPTILINQTQANFYFGGPRSSSSSASRSTR